MSIYQVNKLCYRLHHDPALREAIKANPAKAIADWPFSDAERKAVLTGDVKWLYEAGAHPFLLGHLNRWGVFGLTPAIYAERIKQAHDPA
jgi:hypothetical protein